jgi:hypothetical protein
VLPQPEAEAETDEVILGRLDSLIWHESGTTEFDPAQNKSPRPQQMLCDLGFCGGAGDRDRTGMTSLEGQAVIMPLTRQLSDLRRNHPH